MKQLQKASCYHHRNTYGVLTGHMDLIKIAFIFQIMSFVSVVQAQVKGKVLDATNQQAIEGVHILNKGELIAVTAAGAGLKSTACLREQ
ncbi:MAG: hypothetical protein U5L09_11225 [Bacteroidales bacterium]|nr:hypothetical protein [Bacteroidales bacterium]